MVHGLFMPAAFSRSSQRLGDKLPASSLPHLLIAPPSSFAKAPDWRKKVSSPLAAPSVSLSNPPCRSLSFSLGEHPCRMSMQIA